MNERRAPSRPWSAAVRFAGVPPIVHPTTFNSGA